MQAINLWMILNDIDLRMWEGTLWLSHFTFEEKMIHRSWFGLWDFRCASVAQCAAGITVYRQFHGISWHESCRLKLQRKKSRQKRCRTHPCVAITACYYSIICTCTWPYFVGVCCCSFDINMGNMVNRLLGCLGRAKTRGQGRVIFCGLGDTGLELDVVWANIDPTYIDTVRSLS